MSTKPTTTCAAAGGKAVLDALLAGISSEDVREELARELCDRASAAMVRQAWKAYAAAFPGQTADPADPPGDAVLQRAQRIRGQVVAELADLRDENAQLRASLAELRDEDARLRASLAEAAEVVLEVLTETPESWQKRALLRRVALWGAPPPTAPL